MAQYAFPSSHSPYSTQQPVVYTTSTPSHHGHGGYTYGTPLRRATSAGHAYTTSPGYTYSTAVPSPGVQYLSVPSTHHRSRSHSRHNSHGHHGHGHGHSASASYPSTYATTAPVYVQSSSGHHRSHSRSHRHPSRSHSQSHHSHHHPSHSHSHGYNGDYHRGRAPSVGDRVRQFFGMEPSSNSYYYGDQGRSRHNSFSGKNHSTRTGPLIFGSTNPRGYVDKHGREVDHRGRQIHRY
ncbi:hypothetical protein AZE42_00589 [Rhizopogon vesiculosus]|uniref:Uncharacterized protein n=1 Tax=Rhizopogon vesiculosus TaxID=180088 RepID=A0A1J8QZB8_9AGAM|nr:hypothetical protein AZE42_00589 [Rhizopogon vesiculosus]